MSTEPQCCGECRWYRPRTDRLGECDFPISVPLPACVEALHSMMWADEGTDCPCFERKEISNAI